MQQYFLHKPLQVHDLVEMEPEQAHHIQHVMRMKPDEIIRLADGKGHMYYAHVVSVSYTHLDVYKRQVLSIIG